MARRSSIHVDTSEVNELAVELSFAPQRLKDEVAEVMDNEADALHRMMVRDARNHRYLPNFAEALTKDKLDRFSHEIGFETGKGKSGDSQGSLAHIIVYGSVNNGPVYDFLGPLHFRTPFLVKHLADAAERASFGAKKRRRP